MEPCTVLSHLLRMLPVFSKLSEASFAALMRGAQRRTYARNGYIVQAGDATSGLFVLFAGQAKIFMEGPNGKQLTLCVLRPNEVFGELGALDTGAACAAVIASTPCEVLHIPRHVLKSVLDEDANAAAQFLQHALGRLRSAYWQLETIGLLDVYGRVARVFLENSRMLAGKRVVCPGCEEVARMVGASREMVSRVVKDMGDRGLVRRTGRSIAIIDARALALVEDEAAPARSSAVRASQPPRSARRGIVVRVPRGAKAPARVRVSAGIQR